MTGAADFWSRRKAQVAAEDAAGARASQAEAAAAHEAAQAEKSDAEICEELGLPDPDALEAGDDFRAFMARAVPERLRRRALRRLWLSNPALANLDGLVDYDDDFTDSACVIEGMQTAYQVGKGMLAHVQEMARQAEAEATAEAEAEEADAPGEEAEPVALTEAEPQPGAEPAPAPREATPYEYETATAEADAPLPRHRRMRFDFAEPAEERA